MPNKTEHLDIVVRNYEALKSMINDDPGEHSSWSVVIVFYMALHYVQAYFDYKLKEHPQYHADIQYRIKKTPQLKLIYSRYKQLQDDSEAARYFGKSFDITYIREETLVHFQKIENLVCEVIKENIRIGDLHTFFPLPNRNPSTKF